MSTIYNNSNNNSNNNNDNKNNTNNNTCIHIYIYNRKYMMYTSSTRASWERKLGHPSGCDFQRSARRKYRLFLHLPSCSCPILPEIEFMQTLRIQAVTCSKRKDVSQKNGPA